LARILCWVAVFLMLFSTMAGATGEQWDVVVVGGGGAGLAAAVEAASLGAKVVLLEQLPFLGGSVLVSGGAMSGAGHRFQKQHGILSDSADIHFADMLREGKYKNDTKLARITAENAGAAIDWLADLGCDFRFYPDFPEHTLQRTVRSYPSEGTGAAIIKALQDAAEKAGVTILMQTRGRELIQATDGRVIGVQAETRDGKMINILGRNVILATGGYGASDELLTAYAPEVMAMDPMSAGFAYAYGDGFKMALKAGASLENMQYVKLYPTGARLPDGREVYVRGYIATPHGSIYVNREGRRFVTEFPNTFANIMDSLAEQTDGRMFLIFDDVMRQFIQDTTTPLVIGWSRDDVLRDFEENNLVQEAATLEELADILGIDKKQFLETVKNYNSYIERGEDPEFNRSIAHPIAVPPFYGIEIGPNLMFTLGGVRINEQAEVLSTDGRPIPGLYAAGEVAGAGHGANYMSGNYVAMAIVFGRIAGQNAAMEAMQ